MPLHTFVHNLLNVLVQIASKIAQQPCFGEWQLFEDLGRGDQPVVTYTQDNTNTE
jgi:hypothetical protein